ncbi:hypothetical protein AX17_001344 [Amanita inopinata Kibby_2008]|nr:hypothetical protein AX17_001344 [Amanita inopinata Kibby_2008]
MAQTQGQARESPNIRFPGERHGKSGARCYSVATTQFWSDCSPSPQVLYPTIIALDHTAASVKSHAPLTMLTRQPLPELESFNVFFMGVPATVHLLNLPPVCVDADQLRLLGMFTVRLCRIVMNKPFACALDNITYFLAPLHDSWSSCPVHELRQISCINNQISWELVNTVVATWAVRISTETPELIEKDIRDAVIQDRWSEFTRKFEVVSLRRDLTPLSQVSDNSRESGFKTLLESCKSKSQSFPGVGDYEQPIIQVSLIEPHANYLNPTSRPQTPLSKTPAKYLIPELCNKLTLPIQIYRTALLLPSIFHRIDSILLVKELNAVLFDSVLSDKLLHIAITCPSAAMDFDYERLELLGDAFLKYLASACIIASNSSHSVRYMHDTRQRMTNNKTLLQHALRTIIPSYIQSRQFVTKLWRPPNFQVQQPPGDSLLMDHLDGNRGNGQDDQVQWLGDKTIADVAEAVVGAAYLSGGNETAFTIAKSLCFSSPTVDSWSDLQTKVVISTDLVPVISMAETNVIRFVEERIGYKFNQPCLLIQALVPDSAQNARFSKLDFLGDAVLDFLVTRFVFMRNQDLPPGGLSLLKAAMVSNSTLAAIAVWSGLSDHVLSLSKEVQPISDFSAKLRLRQCEEYRHAREEERLPGQYWRGMKPPKALSELVKLIAGALCISDCFSFVGVDHFTENVLGPFYNKHITFKTLARHPTTALVELLRGNGCQLFDIKKERSGQIVRCEVILHGETIASAEDQTPAQAAMQACRSALNIFEMEPRLFVTHCDCRWRPHKKRDENFFKNLTTVDDT